MINGITVVIAHISKIYFYFPPKKLVLSSRCKHVYRSLRVELSDKFTLNRATVWAFLSFPVTFDTNFFFFFSFVATLISKKKQQINGINKT